MKERINYLDALRGFTMFLVVFGHVMHFSLDLGGYRSVIGSIFLTFRMPMFFFISGYIAYKSIDFWTLDFFKKRFAKKAQIQIIPAVLFFSLFCYLHGGNPLNVFKHGWQGYWFTFVLFEMFVFYYTLSLIGRNTSDKVVDVGLFVLSCLGILWLALADRSPQIYQITCMENLTKYFQFFTFGVLSRKYIGSFEKLISNDYFKAIVIVLFLVCIILYFEDSVMPSVFFSFNHDILVRYLGVLLVFIFFYAKRSYFDQNNRIVSISLFVGRRTLDIYLLHYFFLPDLMCFREWLIPDERMLMQLVAAGFLSCLVISLCLLVSEIIRTSNFLGHYLFGAKRV